MGIEIDNAAGTIKVDGQSVGGGVPDIGARLINASGQTVARYAEIQFSTTPDYDSGGCFNAGTPHRLYAPENGVYAVGGQANPTISGAGYQGGPYIQKNNTNTIASNYEVSHGPQFHHNISTEVELLAGDFVNIKINSNQASIALGTDGTSTPVLWIRKVGEIPA